MKLVFFVLRFIILAAVSFIFAFAYFLLASNYISALAIEHPLSMLFIGVLSTLLFLRPLDQLLKWLLHVKTGKWKKLESFARIRRLIHSLLFEKNLAASGNLFINSLIEELHLDSASVWVETAGAKFLPAAFQGYALNSFKGFFLTAKSPLIAALYQNHEGLKGLGPREPLPANMDSLSGELHKLQAAFVFPLIVEGSLFGFFSIGFKKSSSPPKDEIRFLQSILSEISSVFFILREVDSLSQKLREMPELQKNFLQSAKYSALEQLATGIAHEIHNPLTIISGKAQVLLLRKTKGMDMKQVEEVLATIVQQTKRASDVTRKLLMFSNPSKEERKEIDLEAVIKDTLSLISYQTALEQVNLEKHITPNLPKIVGNEGEIREVFTNLILNAIKATPPKGRVRISLRLNATGERIEFIVEDSGKGIPKEEMEKIFDPFYTSAHESLGLGLYITERLVYKHGGHITAESEEGKGSLFISEFPIFSSLEPILKPKKVGEPV